jgi:hypothetical protein
LGFLSTFSPTEYTLRRFSDVAEASSRYRSSPLVNGTDPADDAYGAELLHGELDLAHHYYPSVP